MLWRNHRSVHAVSRRCLVLALIGGLLFPVAASAQMRTGENLGFERLRGHQERLYLAAQGVGMSLGLQLSALWDELASEEASLNSLASQYDAEEMALQRRDRELIAEVEDSLIPDRQALVAEQGELESEVGNLNAERAGLDSEIQNSPYTADLSQRVEDFNRRNTACRSRINDWEGRRLAFNSRLEDYNARHRSLTQDFEDFWTRERSEYDSRVRAWETQFSEVARLQREEQARIEQELARRSPEEPKPDLAPPTPLMVGTQMATQAINVVALPVRIGVFAVQNPGEAGEQVVGIIPLAATVTTGVKLGTPAAVVVALVTSSYERLKGAEQAEERKLKEDLDRLRLLPVVIRKIDMYRASLEDRQLSADEIRTRTGEYARTLVRNLPGTTGDQDQRLVDSLFLSREANLAVVKSLGIWGVSTAAGKAAAPLIGEVAEDIAPFLGSSDKELKSTKDVLEWGFKRVVKETLKRAPSSQAQESGVDTFRTPSP